MLEKGLDVFERNMVRQVCLENGGFEVSQLAEIGQLNRALHSKNIRRFAFGFVPMGIQIGNELMEWRRGVLGGRFANGRAGG